MRFVIDLDGVVFDFDRGWIERHNKQYGSDIAINQPQEYNQLHLLAGIDTPEAFWFWLRHSGGFHDLQTYPGAGEALEVLSSLGHVTLATSRPVWAREATVSAVRSLAHHDLAFIERKEELLADVYVDDNPTQLVKLYQRHSKSEVWRIVRPWNTPAPPLGILPALSLTDVASSRPGFRQGGSPSVLSAHREQPPLSGHKEATDPIAVAEKIIRAERERTKDE